MLYCFVNYCDQCYVIQLLDQQDCLECECCLRIDGKRGFSNSTENFYSHPIPYFSVSVVQVRAGIESGQGSNPSPKDLHPSTCFLLNQQVLVFVVYIFCLNCLGPARLVMGRSPVLFCMYTHVWVIVYSVYIEGCIRTSS